MTNEIYKFLFIIILLVSFSFKGQESDLINKPFSLEKYANKISNKYGFTIIQSEQLKKRFRENSKYFIKKGWQKIGQENNVIIELLASNEFNPLKIKSGKNTRYLFITHNEELRDTLRVDKQFDYSICQLDKENKNHGLAIGKYKINGKNEFFEIHHLFQITENGNLKRITLDTTIFDCPAPIDHVKDEEPDSYKFGILGGKRMNRYWFENF